MTIKPGQEFNELVTIRELEEKLYNEVAWLCKCSCGNETKATRGQLLRGAKKSCGCLRRRTPTNALNLEDKKFGKLTAIKRVGSTKSNSALWLCECECGNTKVANGTSLRRGDITSCGCLSTERIKHAKKILTTDMTIDGVQVPLLKKGVRSDSQSGHKGIYRRNRNGKITYEPSITIKGKRKYLGVFEKLEDAILARKEAEKEYHHPYIKKLEEKENENK